MKLNRYKKLEEFVSYDGGITYQPTGTFIKGDIIDSGEYNNITDCETPAKIPETLYRWLKYNYEEKYVCEGRDKYYLEYQQVSYNGGLTWSNTGEERKGGVAVYDSDDCKDNVDPDIPTQPTYRWTKQDPSQDNVICDGYKAYYKLIEEVSTDGGKSYTPTGKTMRGELYQENSELCGYQDCDLIDGDTRWVEVENDYICDGYNKSKKLQLEKVVNCQWYKQQTYKSGDVIEENSKDCGYVEPYSFYFYACPKNFTTNEKRMFIVNGYDGWDGQIAGVNVFTFSNPSGYIESTRSFNGQVEKLTSLYQFAYRLPITDLTLLGEWDCSELTNCKRAFSNTNYSGVRTTYKGLEKIDTSNVTDFSLMFNDCGAINNTDLQGIETFNVEKGENFLQMFSNCSVLTDLDISNFNLKNATDVTRMFMSCSSLETLKIGKFELTNLYSLNEMFAYCPKLKTINTSNITFIPNRNGFSLGNMFNGCKKLTEIDLSGLYLTVPSSSSYTVSMEKAFYNCESLERLYIDNIDTTNTGITTMAMFYGCKNLNYIRCKQSFYNMCNTRSWNTNTSNIYNTGLYGSQIESIQWDIVD